MLCRTVGVLDMSGRTVHTNGTTMLAADMTTCTQISGTFRGYQELQLAVFHPAARFDLALHGIRLDCSSRPVILPPEFPKSLMLLELTVAMCVQ